MRRFALAGDRVLTPEGVRPASILIEDGRIVAVQDLDAPGASREAARHVGRLVILPGLVDTHVHINDPGRAEWEGFDSATRAAALGGVTTLVDMPLNSDPPTVTPAALERKRARVAESARVDVGFWAGLVPDSIDRVDDLCDAGARGFKAFMVDSGIAEFPPVDEDHLLRAMPRIARRGVPLLVHAEDPAMVRAPGGAIPDLIAWEASRPPIAEVAAIERLVGAARRTGCRIHVVHVASVDAADRIAEARSEGVSITAETCPHYLTFALEDLPPADAVFKCAPPIRGARHRAGLRQALLAGTIDLIATDHSPCPPAAKATPGGDLGTAWGGIASLGLQLPVLWWEASRCGVDLARLVGWLASAPAELAGFAGRKGAIRPGADADLVLFDPEPVREISTGDLGFRYPVSPYLGRSMRGRVCEVLLRGRTIVKEGEVRAENLGRAL